MSHLTWTERGMCVIGVIATVAVVTMLNIDSDRRYKLPNGEIVECSSMSESSKGNFHLSGCTDGTEYWVSGVLEALRG